MKKHFIALAAAVLAAGMVSLNAQDMTQATELYNKGAEAVTMENWTEAFDNFQKALEMGTAIGADAEELVGNCKNYLPEVSRQIAIGLVNAEKYDEALAKLDETVKLANEYANEEVAAKATELLPDIYKRKGAAAVAIKDYAGAIEDYTKAFAADTTDGKTALTIGQLLGSTGKTAEAIDMLQHAAWNGQEEKAKTQMASIYTREANVAMKASKFAEAIASAEKANAIVETPNAYLIAGQSAQKLGKNAVAIENFTKYVELSPAAKNAAAINFTIAALYQGQKNNAKALEFYKKVQDDPKLGDQAKQMIASLSK